MSSESILRGPNITGHGSSVNPFLVLDGAAQFIDFAVAVFEASENSDMRTSAPDGRLIHAEIVIGDSLVMLSDSLEGWHAHPGLLQTWVADAAEICDRAVALGARTVTPPTPFYGEVTLARIEDPWGDLWWLYAPTPGQADPVPSWEGGDDTVFRTIDAYMRSEP